MKKQSKKKTSKSHQLQKKKPIHPWRLCPPGEHWVRAHSLTIPPSKANPVGGITTRRAHCARNPTGKDQLYPDEIHEISEKRFSKIKNKPTPIDLGFKHGRDYDELIAGWTKYWNDVLKPRTRLTPNVVKALIASESGFDTKILANKKNQNSARGLMQITNHTRKILGNENGELKNYFLTLTREDLHHPSINICAGIRWLFRKHEIASSLLKRSASWEETIAEFKGTRTTTKSRAKILMNRFIEKLELLNQ